MRQKYKKQRKTVKNKMKLSLEEKNVIIRKIVKFMREKNKGKLMT